MNLNYNLGYHFKCERAKRIQRLSGLDCLGPLDEVVSVTKWTWDLIEKSRSFSPHCLADGGFKSSSGIVFVDSTG